MGEPGPTPRLEDTQGNILSEYPQRAMALVFVEFTDTSQVGPWLLDTARHITWGDARLDRQWCLNVHLTYRFLQKIGTRASVLRELPSAFREGMAPRACSMLGDAGRNAPEHWEWPFRERRVDAMVSLHVDDERSIQGLRAQALREVFHRPGVELLREETGGKLDGDREHFGFRDGIGQPHIHGVSPQRATGVIEGLGVPEVPAGEFVLGYPCAGVQRAARVLPGGLGDHSSFLVYRKLSQDVGAFRRFLARSRSTPGQQDQLAAWMVGRWPNGASLVQHPVRMGAVEDRELDDFNYADDPDGRICPLGSHARRMNPRNRRTASHKHRIVRRGMPYGSPLSCDTTENDGLDRGLLFQAYNSSIEEQFEFLQRMWVGNGNFAGLASYEDDPLIGGRGATGSSLLRVEPSRIGGIPRFVTVLGGEYFLTPGRGALERILAGRG